MNTQKKLFSFSKKEIAFFFAHARIKIAQAGLKLYKLSSKAPLDGPLVTEFGKILIITPARSGNACKRNLFRRRIKAIYCEESLYNNKGIFALYVYKEGLECSQIKLKEFLLKAIPPL